MKKTFKVSFLGIITFIFFIIFGGIVGIFSAGASIYFDVFPVFVFIPTIIFLFLLIVLGIVTHELGHLIGGLISGYNFLSFRVGSFVLVKHKDGTSFKKISIPGTIGECTLTPPKYDEGNYHYKLFLYGGSILNLIVGTISVLLIFLPNINFIAKYIFILFALIQLFMIVTNAIPYKDVINNDGAKVVSLKESEESRKDFWTSLKINSLITNGLIYSKIPEELLELSETTNIFSHNIYSAAAKKEMELENYEEALVLLNNINDDTNYSSLTKSLNKYDLLSCLILSKKDDDYDSLITELNLLMDDEFYKFDKKSKNNISKMTFWLIYSNYITKKIRKIKLYVEEFNNLSDNYPVLGEINNKKIILNNILKEKH